MRVGVGVILSVLSSSVLAAVIPTYDDHGLLLARRTVNTETKVVLWKRNNEKQTGPGPSSSGSGANAGASTSNGKINPDNSGINDELRKLGHLGYYLDRLYKSYYKTGRSLMRRIAHKRDKKIIKNAIKKVAGAIEGEQAKQIIVVIEKMLTTALVSARTTLELFNNKAKTPLFVVSIPKGKDKKTVTKEMVEIQNLAKKEVKDHIKILTGIIASTTKSPQYLKSKLDMISRKVGDMCTMFKNLYHKNYKDLISKVEPTNNEKNIQLIEEFLSELIKYRSAFYAIIDYINEERRSNRLKLKKTIPTKTPALATRVRKRLGMKTKPSTDETPDQEPSDQEPSGQEPSVQGVGQLVNGVFG